jgi:hypothetical protein
MRQVDSQLVGSWNSPAEASFRSRDSQANAHGLPHRDDERTLGIPMGTTGRTVSLVAPGRIAVSRTAGSGGPLVPQALVVAAAGTAARTGGGRLSREGHGALAVPMMMAPRFRGRKHRITGRLTVDLLGGISSV